MAGRGGVPWRRLATLARPEVSTLALATVALLISSGLTLVYPQVVKWLVDLLEQQGDTGQLDRAAGWLLAMFFVQAVFAMVRAWLFTVAGERVVTRLRKELF